MTPTYISGCFGVLHPAAGKRGVLICSTMGDEALNVYRPLVHLAERFARAGVPTLRLDYYGHGDSGGEDGEAGRFQSWLNGIAAGVRWLRDVHELDSVTLVGVRIGAALAARAACDIDGIDGLVSLLPVASGRRFLREMILRAKTVADIWQVQPRIEEGEWFEAHGARLDRPTRDALDRLDVAKLPLRPAARALILDQTDSPAGGTMADRLRGMGVDVTIESFEGLGEMLRDPYENSIPHAAFERVVSWHAQQAAACGSVTGLDTDGSLVRAEPVVRTDFAARLPALAASETLSWDIAQETPVSFGPQQSLFGILCTPNQPRANTPPVLIANTGANPRSGNSRNAVKIARWLASNGIASLRMDGAGVGDSALDTGERGQPYSTQGDQDVVAGIDELSRRFASSVLLLGMCSGAFHALRVAYDDRRVAGLMLVNLQKFLWEDGESLSVVQRTTFRTTRFYLKNVLSRDIWRRVFQGEVNVSGISRALAGRAMRRVGAALDPALAKLRRVETKVGRVRRQVRGLRQRQVPILFVLSGNDPGLDEISEYFGSGGRHFRRQSNVMFCLLDGADHTLSAHWARERLLQMIADFLAQRCQTAFQRHCGNMLSTPRTASARLGGRFRASIAIDTTGSAA